MVRQATQDLIYNVTGQSFVFDAPYRPSSVTSVTVLPWDSGDDDTAETATTGSASISAVNTTFDASAGAAQANPRTCPLAATTSIEVGGQYLAVNAALESEWVDVVSVTNAVSVEARSPLLNDYAAGATFQGTRISISVLDAWIQDDNKISDGVDANPGYRIRWVWVGTPPGGVQSTFVHYTYADVVRAPGVELVTPADMERFLPGWSVILPTNHRDDGGRALIAEAYQDVKMRLLQANVPDQQTRNAEAVQQLVKYAARMIMHRQKFDNGGDLTVYQESRDEYVALLGGMFTVTGRVARGVNDSGAGARTRGTGLWSR